MWKPIDTEFYGPRLPVAIACISSGAEQFIRNTLESLNCVVLLHLIGTPSDFLKVIAQGENAPRYLIIEGHGTDDGLVFGEYIPSIDTSMLKNECLPAEVIREHVNLPGCTVFSNTCNGGDPAMARAFLAGGVAAYMGCRTQPDAVASNLLLHHFLYGVTAKKLSDRDSWHRAVAAVEHEEIDQFSFFHSDGREERF